MSEQALKVKKPMIALALNRKTLGMRATAMILAMLEGKECENMREGLERFGFPEDFPLGRSTERERITGKTFQGMAWYS